MLASSALAELDADAELVDEAVDESVADDEAENEADEVLLREEVPCIAFCEEVNEADCVTVLVDEATLLRVVVSDDECENALLDDGDEPNVAVVVAVKEPDADADVETVAVAEHDIVPEAEADNESVADADEDALNEPDVELDRARLWVRDIKPVEVSDLVAARANVWVAVNVAASDAVSVAVSVAKDVGIGDEEDAVSAGDIDREGLADRVLVGEARCVEVGVALGTAVRVRVEVEVREPDLVRLDEDVLEVVLDSVEDWVVLRVADGDMPACTGE